MLHRQPEQPAGSQGLKRFGVALTMCWLVVMLSGCMEALQSGQGGPISRPSLPTPTAGTTDPPLTATAVSPTAAGTAVLEPTAAPLPSPSPAAPSETATVVVVSPPPTTGPAQTLPTLALPTLPAVTNEERWRAQQIDRQPFEGPRPFYSTGSELWWYDPLNQQSIILGRITGEFLGQAEFTLRGQGVRALEVPYQVNVSYGLTALSPVVLDRIRAAGYTEWIETYVFLTPDVIVR